MIFRNGYRVPGFVAVDSPRLLGGLHVPPPEYGSSSGIQAIALIPIAPNLSCIFRSLDSLITQSCALAIMIIAQNKRRGFRDIQTDR